MVLGRELRVWLLSHGTRATSDLLSGAVIARRAGGTSSGTSSVTAFVAATVAATVAAAAEPVAAVIAALIAAMIAVAIAVTCQPPPIACATDSTRDHRRMRRETCLLVVWYELPTAGRREHGDVDEHPAHRSGRATAMLDRHARSQTSTKPVSRRAVSPDLERRLGASDFRARHAVELITRDSKRVTYLFTTDSLPSSFFSTRVQTPPHDSPRPAAWQTPPDPTYRSPRSRPRRTRRRQSMGSTYRRRDR